MEAGLDQFFWPCLPLQLSSVLLLWPIPKMQALSPWPSLLPLPNQETLWSGNRMNVHSAGSAGKYAQHPDPAIAGYCLLKVREVIVKLQASQTFLTAESQVSCLVWAKAKETDCRLAGGVGVCVNAGGGRVKIWIQMTLTSRAKVWHRLEEALRSLCSQTTCTLQHSLTHTHTPHLPACTCRVDSMPMVIPIFCNRKNDSEKFC